MTDQKRKRGNGFKSTPMRGYAVWSGLVFQMAAMVIGGFLTGKLFNRYLYDTNQWAEMVGLLFGVVAAIVFSIRFILRNQHK